MGRYMTKEQVQREFYKATAANRPEDKGGKATYKTATAAARAAEAARDEARGERKAAGEMLAQVELYLTQVHAESNAALVECRAVCGRAVGLCVVCMLASWVPWVLWVLLS